jgi:hypothetical protein
MAKKLNRRSQQRLKRMTDSLEAIARFTNKISVNELENLVRRDEIGVDSYAVSNTGTSIASSSRGASSELTPTERAAEINIKGKKPYDPVREEVKKIEKKIIQSEENLRQIVESIKFLKEGVEKKRNRQASSEPCEICKVLPAIKTAMCADCYVQWVDAGAPDRFRWRAYMHQLTATDGQILVPEMPAARRSILNT